MDKNKRIAKLKKEIRKIQNKIERVKKSIKSFEMSRVIAEYRIKKINLAIEQLYNVLIDLQLELDEKQKQLKEVVGDEDTKSNI